jgi:hypothetical protein
MRKNKRLFPFIEKTLKFPVKSSKFLKINDPTAEKHKYHQSFDLLNEISVKLKKICTFASRV